MSMFSFRPGRKTEKLFQLRIREEFLRQSLKPAKAIALEELEHLPAPVQKYLVYSGAVGKSNPQNVRIEFEAEMYRKPGDSPMKATSVQYNFFGSYTRIFLMKASKMLIPFKAKHIYSDQQATFQVKLAGLFNIVDLKGEELTKAETVTVLNDLCLFAPAGLADKRLSWREIDPLSCEVTLCNGSYTVSATLYFNQQGELVNFISDDRSALQDDGTIKSARWSTPVNNYMEIEGRMIPVYGETIWHYPEGDFTYGKFRLKQIQYDVLI